MCNCTLSICLLECVCFLSSVLTVWHRSTECQRQPELSITEFGESLNDADTRSEGSDDEIRDEWTGRNNSELQSLTNSFHACDRYSTTDKAGAAVTSAALEDIVIS